MVFFFHVIKNNDENVLAQKRIRKRAERPVSGFRGRRRRRLSKSRPKWLRDDDARRPMEQTGGGAQQGGRRRRRAEQ